MAFEMGEETRQVQGTWDLSTYKYRVDGTGMKLLTDSMKEKKLRGIRCHNCGTVYMPGPSYCRKCHIDIDEVVDVKDTGSIMSYAVDMADVRGEPLEKIRVTAMIRFDGADAWIIGTIEDIDWHDVKVGMKVKAIWKDKTEGNFGDVEKFVQA